MTDKIIADHLDRCRCPDPDLCAKLRRHVAGRSWEVWNGIDVEPAEAAAHRDKWLAEAGELPPLPLKARVDKGTKL